MISAEAVDEFKKIYFKKYGVEIPQERAMELATRHLILFRAVYKPIPIKALDYSKKGGLKLR